MARLLLLGLAAVVCIELATCYARAAEFVPIQHYKDATDSMFPEFGFEGSLLIEDFEDGAVNVKGLTQVTLQNLTTGTSIVRAGHSVPADGEREGRPGLALEGIPSVCATSFPMQCPATVSFAFDEQAFGSLPTYVGFVWTDAVRASDTTVHPWARVNVIDASGRSNTALINELPTIDSLADAASDDTLISFINDQGIRRMDITVVTDGTGLGGHFAIDHVQFGVAARAGDADIDGDVDFIDFLALSGSFGGPASWRTGDFNFDKQANFPDFLKLSTNFGSTTAVETPQGVPEPNIPVWAWALGIGLMARGSRRSR